MYSWLDRDVELIKGKNKKEIFHGEAPKTYVDITYHGGCKYTLDNAYVLRSMISVLSIKLRESLREDIGGVYGVRATGGAYNEPKEKYEHQYLFQL